MRWEPCPPECVTAREAVSALLDGEEPGLATGWLIGHLVGCAECRRWYATASDLQRRSRLALAPQVPDLSAVILAGIGQAPHRRRRPHRRRWPTVTTVLRLLLATVAAAQLWFSVPPLVLARDDPAGMHPAHELGSFDAALGCGLLFAAWRPWAARGTRPLVGAVALLLLVTAVLDLTHGRTTYLDEAPHLLALAGFAVLTLLSRNQHDDPSGTPVHPATADGAASGIRATGVENGADAAPPYDGPVSKPPAARTAGPSTAGPSTTGPNTADFGSLVTRWQRDVWLLCCHLGDAVVADDLTQETFLRAYRAWGTFRGESTPRTWLLAIARRVCVDHVRGAERQRRLLARATTAAGQFGETAVDPAGEVPLWDLIRRLPHDQRAAFVLTQVFALSYAEAATVCECPVGTIRSRVARARADLIAGHDSDEAVSTRRNVAP